MTYNTKATILSVVFLLIAVILADLLIGPVISSLPIWLQASVIGLVVGWVSLAAALYMIADAIPFIVARRLIIGGLVMIGISAFTRLRDGISLLDGNSPIWGLFILLGFAMAAWTALRFLGGSPSKKGMSQS